MIEKKVYLGKSYLLVSEPKILYPVSLNRFLLVTETKHLSENDT